MCVCVFLSLCGWVGGGVAMTHKSLNLTHTQTVSDLEGVLHQQWALVPQQTIQMLIGSMRRAVQAVINTHGSYTRY